MENGNKAAIVRRAAGGKKVAIRLLTCCSGDQDVCRQAWCYAYPTEAGPQQAANREGYVVLRKLQLMCTIACMFFHDFAHHLVLCWCPQPD
jgi:hypothetical protein